jgi:hypothetical protein
MENNFCKTTDFCKEKIYYNLSENTKEKAHFLLLEKSGNKSVVFFNGSLNQKEISNHDTLLVEIESDEIYNQMIEVWDNIKGNSRPLDSGVDFTRAEAGDISVTEIVWMGSIDNFDKKHLSDEAIEIFNGSGKTLNAGSLIFACTKDSGLSVSDYFALPPVVLLDPGYFVIASRSDGAFPFADLIEFDLSLSNTNQECLLIDNSVSASVYHPEGAVSGHYNDSRLSGIIIDKILNYNGEAWNSYASDFYSRTGLNTLKHGVMGAEGSRSMEKNFPDSNGSLIQNWHTGSNDVINNAGLPQFIYRTFTTLGKENTPPAPAAENSPVIINEVHWMGSYNDLGVSNSSDEFVEFYNNSDTPVNTGGWIFGCTTNNGATGKPSFAFPYGTVINPGEFFVVANSGSSAFIHSNLFFDFALVNTTTQCILTDGNPYTVDFTGADGNANGFLDGHYDNFTFFGRIVDYISDRSDTLAGYGIGQNNTSKKIRRSAERIDKNISGEFPSNWKSNSISDYLTNTFINDPFRSNTFATPGSENSP